MSQRSALRYYLGLIVRWKQHFKYAKAVKIARKRGATIGEGVIMPISLAKKANKHLVVGNHVSIQTDKIDLRSPVIIGSNTEIITTSHNIESPEWEHKILWYSNRRLCMAANQHPCPPVMHVYWQGCCRKQWKRCSQKC